MGPAETVEGKKIFGQYIYDILSDKSKKAPKI